MTPYEALLSHLAANEPRYGWLSEDEIRPLTDLEISVCLDHDTNILGHLAKRVTRITCLLIATELGKHSSPSERAEKVGLIMRNKLEWMCRVFLLSELQQLSYAKESRDVST